MLKNSLPSLLFTTLMLIPIFAKAQSITIWGTRHDGNYCSMEHENLASMLKDGASGLPENFIYGMEGIFSSANTEYIRSIEDENIAIYTSLFVDTYQFIYDIRDAFRKESQDLDFYRFGFFDFYDRLITKSKISPQINASAKKILASDKNEIYFHNISGDIEMWNELVSAGGMEQNNLAVEIRKPGILSFLEEKFTKNQTNTFFNEEELKVLDSYLDNYILLTQRIAEDFFHNKIEFLKTNYNVTIDDSGSKYNGKKVFDFAQPRYFFNKTVVFDDDAYQTILDTVIRYWRSYFMAQNIINLMKENTDSNILAWVGDAHTKDIVNALSKSPKLSNDVKNKTRVLSYKVEPGISCSDYRNVLGVVGGQVPVKNLTEWTKRYGYMDDHYQLRIYDLKGRKILYDKFYDENIEEDFVTNAMQETLKFFKSKSGIYIIQIKTDSDQPFAAYKMVLIANSDGS